MVFCIGRTKAQWRHQLSKSNLIVKEDVLLRKGKVKSLSWGEEIPMKEIGERQGFMCIKGNGDWIDYNLPIERCHTQYYFLGTPVGTEHVSTWISKVNYWGWSFSLAKVITNITYTIKEERDRERERIFHNTIQQRSREIWPAEKSKYCSVKF